MMKFKNRRANGVAVGLYGILRRFLKSTARNPMQDGGLHPPYGRPGGALHSNDRQQCDLCLDQATGICC